MKNKTKSSRINSKKKLPWRSGLIILSLIVFFPVGIPLMWKFATWKKKTKWIVTGVVALLAVLGFTMSFYSEPRISVEGSRGGRLSTDNPSYVIKGYIDSMRGDTNLLINDEPVYMGDDLRFSHQVSLEEGENLVKLESTNGNGTTIENVVIYRTTSAELALRLAEAEAKALAEARLNAQAEAEKAKDQAGTKAQADAKRAQDEADKRVREAEKAIAEAEKRVKAAEKRANSKVEVDTQKDCNWWCRITGGDKKTEARTTSAGTDCNWWCRLTGGGKSKPQSKATSKEKPSKVVKDTKPYKQFSSFIPKGSSHANIQNWAYTGSKNLSIGQVKGYMKDIFDEQCGEGTSWARCEILLWDKEYNVNTSVYSDTCVGSAPYKNQLIGYIKGTSGTGQFFYKCVSGNVRLEKASNGLLVTDSIDGKSKYTTSYYVDSGYVNEPAY